MSLLLFITFYGQEKYSKVRVFADQNEIVSLMSEGIDMENIGGKPGFYIDIELNSTELNKVNKLNLDYEILIDDVTTFYQERYSKSLADFGKSTKGILYTTPDNFNFGSMGGFLTLDEIYAELDEMVSLFPNLITPKYIIGNSQTIEGRDMYAVKISDNPTVDESEAEVLYTSLTHAREPAAMQALIWYMWYLLENYGTDDEITYLIDNLEMYFVPVVNPDGYEYNYQQNPSGGGMWRKNMKDNNGGGFSEYYDGVDLNRNFGYQWGYDDNGSSPDPSSLTYRGTSAFSEPETQILRDFTNEHEFLLAHNHHTYSDLIIIPWGYEEIHTPDDDFLRTSANLMASENGYTVGQGWEILYTVNGDANDWMYGEQSSKPKIFAYTQETGSGSDGFWPSQDRIIPLCEESYLSNLYLARFATAYIEISDNTPQYISRTGDIEFNLKRMGISGNGSYSVMIDPDPTVFSQLGDSYLIQLNEPLDSESGLISYILSDDIEYGDEFSFTITVSQGDYIVSKVFTKSYYEVEVLMEDNGDNLDNWSTSSWSTTDESSHSPEFSITDSEGSNYPDNANNAITLSEAIDLTNIENPSLNFWAKWSIESNWDYVQLLISTDDGSTWTPMETDHTEAGEGSFQPTGEPVYDGNSSWVEEIIDLSDYIGESVLFKFELHSDGYVNEDGFYFDDFSIISTLASPVAASLIVEDGCGENTGTATIFSTQSGNQTFYLKDESGNTLDQCTGEGSLYSFLNLPDGLYRAQVEFEGDFSTMTDVQEIVNAFEEPTDPDTAYTDNSDLCMGESAILTFEGGSGGEFVWYAGVCGCDIAGYGNNVVVYPTQTTEYNGRWENGCGGSIPVKVLIFVSKEISIQTHPEDIQANYGETVSFTVSASGDNLNYQWRKNTQDILGANESSYEIINFGASDEGSYDVVITNACGSETSEAAILSSSVSVSTSTDKNIELFPNPSSGSFTIRFPENVENGEILISDMTGKTVLIKEIYTGQNELRFTEFKQGIYLIKISFNDHQYISKLIIK